LEEARFYELPELERLVAKEISKGRSQERSGGYGQQQTLSARFGTYFDE
jgi:hypothetical protein